MSENKNTENREYSISPDEYAKILKGLELVKVFLGESCLKGDVRLVETAQADNVPIRIRVNEDASYEVEKSIVNIKYAYDLKATVGKKRAISITAIFTMVFTSEEEFTEEFFEVFRNVALPYQIWPFFRELVSSFTSRMDIPKLSLPLRKSVNA